MSSQKYNRGKRPVRRKSRILPALMTFLCVAAAMAAVAFLTSKNEEKAKNDAAAHGTPAWPYGTPEYVIEVPPGYEDLLPATDTDGTVAPAAGAAVVAEPEPAGISGAGTAEKTAVSAKRASTGAGANDARSAKPVPETLRGGTMIIVIDDSGYSLSQLDAFLKLPFPLTIAVLPGLPDSAEAARRTLLAGKELILHQPMQALGGQNPGPGAISLDMTPEAAKAVVAKNLDELPGAVGMNNHMGSAVTRERLLMDPVLSLAKERGIYYLDSLTAPDTVVREASLGLDMQPWERDVFLDNAGDRSSILNALTEGKHTASSKGSAVMIGHVWSTDLARTLMEVYPQLVAEGYSLSTISRYMMLEAAQELSADDAPAGN
ncbi:MAG: divergent polysaccharide deacetylase family protein [Rectinema sp.]